MAKLKHVNDYITDLIMGGAKFLVFAHHRPVLDGIQQQLDHVGVDYFRIDGSTPPKLRHEVLHMHQPQ